MYIDRWIDRGVNPRRSLLAEELDKLASTSKVKIAELVRQLEESRARVRTYDIYISERKRYIHTYIHIDAYRYIYVYVCMYR